MSEQETGGKEITKALLAFHKMAESVKKNSKNSHFRSSYADISQILVAVMPVLTECGLIVTQIFDKDDILTTIIKHESGEEIRSEVLVQCKDRTNPQSLKSAATYCRRMSLLAILAIQEVDDDGQEASASALYQNNQQSQYQNRQQYQQSSPVSQPQESMTQYTRKTIENILRSSAFKDFEKEDIQKFLDKGGSEYDAQSRLKWLQDTRAKRKAEQKQQREPGMEG